MYDDVIELMETLNRILNPVNNMFYIKYGKDEVSRVCELMTLSMINFAL